MCSARTPDFMNSSRRWIECRDIDREGDRLSALGVLVPVGDDVADELRPVHAIGELALDVIADARFDAFQVRIDRRVARGF